MITKENIIKVYTDNGFLFHKTNGKFMLSAPEWNKPDDQIGIDIQDSILQGHRTLTISLDRMLIKLLENNLIEIE